MYDVILFGGTDEGHKIADFLNEHNINHVVCVATDYGAQLLDNKNVHIGRMNEQEMREFFVKNNPKVIVDATHPYAQCVTENILKSCNCRYIRVVRDDVTDDFGICFNSIRAASDYLKRTDGNILITTGSKEIAQFGGLSGRAYARVLPSEESLRLCLEAGFEPKRIICMQGPFSKDFNAALIRELNIKRLVTKRTGRSGGFIEKIEAAKEEGIECIIINRPAEESGFTVGETEKQILELL